MSLFGDEEETATPTSPAKSSSGGGGGQTVGERLEAKWAQDQQRGLEQQSAFQRRQQKRREYFEKAGLPPRLPHPLPTTTALPRSTAAATAATTTTQHCIELPSGDEGADRDRHTMMMHR